ncbi:MAG: exodeoxyribonuclease VII large subunit [Firmicutes bacterium]|nr:exodeoxyribonuclease VII large subunit [Bacillota bacterium]
MGLNPIRVGQLNQYIGRILKTDPLLSDVSVVGEISNLKFHSSGHIYFSLKDETSRIDCFLSSRIAPQIRCPLDEGLEVVASGYVSVYERGGRYSLNIMDLEAAGMGQLAIRFEQLKTKLEREGLFDPAHKKPIPAFPSKVAVITSPTGAAVRDIQKIIRSKNDYVSILIVPVLVQGPSAAPDIAAAISEVNDRCPDVDVIITGRGGGSAEELWAFNEEVVARSIFASRIPVISAVGHETDFTISDFVADLRAETPTAAADKAVPDTNELRQNILYYREEMVRALEHRTEIARQRLSALDPTAFASGIRSRIEYDQMYIDRIADSMTEQMAQRIRDHSHRIELLRNTIESASPYELLKRGYSMVTGEGDQVLHSIRDLSPGQNIRIRMTDGSADAQIVRVSKEERQ